MKAKYTLTLVRNPRTKEYFWRIVHQNGKQICRSSETYKRKIDCEGASNRLLIAISAGDYSVVRE